ncbi:MAG TPA: hypothetical protein VGX03_17720, partial [Candidatus Binatia bacterium]|nr:hypothetical protein [Candidatus Binatia bacterium]
QEALVTWLLAETERRPVVVVCEDLHWVDPSTLEVLGLYIDRVPTARLLLLLTFRPDFRPPWALLSHLTQVTLSRLGRGHVEEIVQRVTGGKALPDEVLQQIVHKTDGVPLFVEELTKMVVESGLLQEAEGHYELTGPLPPLAIPATLREHLDQGLALYDPQQYRSLTWAGALPAVQCLYFGANSLWLLGHPDQALKRIQEALTLAQKLSHPLSQAVVLQWDATLHLLRRERNAAQERAEAVITLSTEHGFSVYSATGTIARGWALAEQGQIEEGIVQIRQGLAALSVIGVEVGRPAFLALLAETYGKVGQAEEGLAVLAEALATVNKTGECWWEAEMYRVKGQLTLQQFQVSGSKFQVDNPQSAFRNWRRKPKRAS